jgi:hypothetical protein
MSGSVQPRPKIGAWQASSMRILTVERDQGGA